MTIEQIRHVYNMTKEIKIDLYQRLDKVLNDYMLAITGDDSLCTAIVYEGFYIHNFWSSPITVSVIKKKYQHKHKNGYDPDLYTSHDNRFLDIMNIAVYGEIWGEDTQKGLIVLKDFYKFATTEEFSSDRVYKEIEMLYSSLKV